MISIRQFFTTSVLLFSIPLFSQRIGIGTTTPDSSAILDIVSTDKGILIPRLTSAQRLMIGGPKPGLLVFDSTTTTFWFNENQSWMEMQNHWVHNGNDIYNANSGNVGIGLANPTAPLDVFGIIRSLRPGSSPDGSSVSFASPDDDPGIIFDRGNGTGGQLRRWDMKIDDDQSFRIRDHSAETDRLMITVTGNIGIGTTSPHASAALDIASTERGFLPPRMTQVQRDAIASLVAGLMIWCNDCGEYGQTQVYNGSSWTNL